MCVCLDIPHITEVEVLVNIFLKRYFPLTFTTIITISKHAYRITLSYNH